MSRLALVQKAIYEIKTQVQNDKDIRKLLLHDVDNALSGSDTTYAQAEDYIVVAPIFDMTKEPFNKNTIISVALVRGVQEEEKEIMTGMLKINVLTQSGLWKLTNNKIRPLEIGNLIINVLDGFKMATSHKLVFDSIELAVLNENINGYSINFYLNDGSGLIGDF